jgi:hypothetical protein
MSRYASKSGVSNVTVTLRGISEERTITYDGNYTGTVSPDTSEEGLFIIREGTTFVLDENITLDGQNTELYIKDNSGASLVIVAGGGKFKMKAGSKITRSIAGYGAVHLAVFLNAASSEFVMEGGEICNNSNYSSGDFHASVRLTGACAFRMEGGKFSGNSRGVAISSTTSVFTMTGGEISGNGLNIGRPGAAVDVGGSFIMTGGKIINNGSPGIPAGGIYQGERNATVTLNGPVTISGNSVNVWVYSQYYVGNITIGESFANDSDGPIVVDVTGRSGATYGTLANIIAWTASKPLLSGSQAAIAQFTPGLTAHASSASCTVHDPQPATFTINTNGSFTIAR